MTEFFPVLLIHFSINNQNRPAFIVRSLVFVRELSVKIENAESIERNIKRKLCDLNAEVTERKFQTTFKENLFQLKIFYV